MTKSVYGALWLTAALAMSGCASRDGIRVPGPAETVTSDKAFALPPPGGPSIVNVVQHSYNNAVQQDIYLFTSAATSGQNDLQVTFFGPVGLDYDNRKGLGYASIRDSTVDRDMRRALPGVAMVRSGIYVQNNYGPFGYATGKSAQGDTCLYAWQQVRSSDNARGAFQNRGTVQVRLRLCDTHAPAEQLLRVMYGYTITGTFPAPGWNPYDSAPPVDPTLGRTGNPIYPVVSPTSAGQLPAAFQLPAASPGIAPQSPRRVELRAAPRPVAQQQAPAPAPRGPVVPSPIGHDKSSTTAAPAVIVPAPN
ncbi:cellulose biosynthesis protein BcsN [Rhizobium tumorigenes]|uniref:Cellulose biosynthesis protein BcsN n=1 Tax=Rhizobium tumorigenes TaxID=2041385 RepID=A0AAF1KS99_9HYPH|nr:cellulose biosynthesis protein BcsN [Rhizobium tumorigenes]WFR95530.1 cellulose biosynthesis protein BcsN [Rhizobium tumorigenes]